MWYSLDLCSGHVVEVRVDVCELIDGGFQTGSLSIIKNNNPESIARIIQIASCADSIENDLIIFSAAGNKDINAGNLIGGQSQLRPISLLQCPHGPEIMHLRRNRDNDLHA